MKKILLFTMIVLLCIASKPLWAQEEKKKGASETAYEHASENAIFNRVSDWFATIGKSKEEKARILEERRLQRAAKRAEKELRKAQKEVEEATRREERERERVQERIREQQGDVQKGLGKGRGKGRNK